MKAKRWTRLFTVLTVLLCLGCVAAIVLFSVPGAFDRLDETGVTAGFFGCAAMFLLAVVSLVLTVYSDEYGVRKGLRIALAVIALCAIGCSLLLGCVFFMAAALMGRAAMDTVAILPRLTVCR